MKQNLYDHIYEKLQEPVKIYLSKETKEMLEVDFKNFKIANKNQFYNLLISNYIDEYTSSLNETAKVILNRMKELIYARNEDEFPVIARKLLFDSSNIYDLKDKEIYISIRININNIDKIADEIASTSDEVKVSTFFRNLFLKYLTLPSYKREQIIYLEKYKIIKKALDEKLKISYRNKYSKKSHVFNIYSIEHSNTEFHNYLVGSFEGRDGASSIKLISIESIRILNESVTYNETFKKCYNLMKLNGFQFSINEVSYYKIYLDDDDLDTYEGRYLDRPTIYKQGIDKNGKYYIFNCSRFQLEGYFTPFRNDIEILDYIDD